MNARRVIAAHDLACARQRRNLRHDYRDGRAAASDAIHQNRCRRLLSPEIARGCGPQGKTTRLGRFGTGGDASRSWSIRCCV